MKVARSVAEVLSQHMTLALECIDRMHLNVYVPLLQTGAGVAYFFRKIRDRPVLMAPTTRLREAVAIYDREVDRAWHGQALGRVTACSREWRK